MTSFCVESNKQYIMPIPNTVCKVSVLQVAKDEFRYESFPNFVSIFSTIHSIDIKNESFIAGTALKDTNVKQTMW